MDEQKKYLEKSGFVGSKMHFGIFPNKITNGINLEIADLTHQEKKIMLIDVGTNPRNMKGFGEFARKYPDLVIIVAHLGSLMPEVIEAARKYDNVYLDMAGYPITKNNLGRVLEIVGASKIIFGSDATIGGNIQDSLKTLNSLGLAPRKKELILSGNILHVAGDIITKRKLEKLTFPVEINKN